MEPHFSPETLHHFLSRNPWLRLVLPFGTGIAAGLYMPASSRFFYVEMYGLLPLLLLAYFLTSYSKHGMGLRSWIPGSIGLLFLICTGFQFTRAHISLHDPAHFSNDATEALYIRVHSIPENRGKFLRFDGRVLAGKIPEPSRHLNAGEPEFKPLKGRLLVYLRIDSSALADGRKMPVYGDELWIEADYQEVPPPSNPAAFDFRAYLIGKDIYHQTFLNRGQWIVSGKNSGNWLIKWSAGLQKRCVAALERLFTRKENAALLSAFVLGHRSGIDRQVLDAFAATGTIHILSVSGLHVAILYWLAQLLLKPLRFLPGGRGLHLAAMVSVIGFYALITGLSPPVCRAACMIIFYAIAACFHRQHQSENTLALTAFLLLAAEPLMLADVGFQLSFLAVAGLIFYFPSLLHLFPAEPARSRPSRRNSWWNRAVSGKVWWRLMKYLWSMTAVSLTAQLTTFPLAVYYFHQFPVYFLPANLVLIPLGSLILYGGIALLLISSTGAPALFLAEQLSFLIDLMKSGMHFFSTLPGALIEGIWMTAAECVGWYLLILCGAFFLRYRKPLALVISLCISMVLACSYLLENLRLARQRLLVFYDVNEGTVGFFAGRSAVLFTTIPHHSQAFEYSIRPFLHQSGIRQLRLARPDSNVTAPFLSKENAYLQFFDLRLLLVDKQFRYPKVAGQTLPCDLLLITENTYLQMGKLRKAFDIKMLVSGGGLSGAMDHYLESYCRENGIPFYSIRKSGAFVLRMPRQRN